MARFPNDAELYSMLIKIMDDILKEWGMKIAASHVVSGQNPTRKNYIRTGDVKRGFLNAGAKESGFNMIEASLYDVSQVAPSQSRSSYLFNHHMSWDGSTEWNGFYIPEQVPEWLNDGFTIVNQKGHRAYFAGTKYIEDALGLTTLRDGAIQKKFEKEAAKRLYNKLKGRGVI